MASGKNIKISITSALNAAGIEATKQQIDQMAKSVKKSMGDAATANRHHWADIKAAWDMGCSAIKKAWQAASAGLREAFKFETQTTQFKTLIGNIDAARAHMADLKALGDTPPFSLDEFAKTSRSLMVMTDGVLGYKKSLELVGDAAAATGYPIEELGQAVGRMYAFIRDGQPLSRAVMQLRNMGVITHEVAQKLQDLQKAGKSNAEIWAEVEAQLGRYKGAMEATEKTGDGLLGAISSRWNNIIRQFGQALEEEAKDGLEAVNEAAKNLEESGDIEVWAARAVAALHEVKEAASAVGAALNWVYEKSGASDVVSFATARIGKPVYTATRAAAGIVNGEGVLKSILNAKVEGDEYFYQKLVEGHYFGKVAEKGWLGNAGKYAVQQNQRQSEYQSIIDERIRERARKRREQREQQDAAAKAQRELEEQKRIEENLAAAQKKQDEKRLAEEATKKEEAARKAAETQQRLDQQAADRRQQLEEKALQQKIKNHQKLLQLENQNAAAARSTASAAESKLQRAWGWYRDKESMAAQIQEEKADAAARKQYEKDFERLKSKRRDWRTAENLSVDDEAVRRVALAQEEKQAAEQHLAEIEKNTADLSAKLDELLSVKG